MTNAYFLFARKNRSDNHKFNLMALKLQNISKRYGDRWILRDVSFEVERGEILGLIGENAVGKSTILRLINGDEKVNSGEVLFEERKITNIPVAERGFSFPQNHEQSSWKDLFRSDKTDKEDISDGQKQRFLIEKAVQTSEKAVLLDNPFSAMNYELRDETYQVLREKVKEKNLAVVLATNNMDSAFAVCDRLAILQNGEIAQIDEPRTLYEKPESIAAARSLGRNNLIPAMRVTFNNEPTQEFQTLAGDHRLLTDKTERKMLGAITAPVTLAIRPEHISISFGASFPEDNLIKAKIVDIRYQGATTLLKLDANGLILESLVLRLVGLNVGDECMVGLPPDRIMVLKS